MTVIQNVVKRESAERAKWRVEGVLFESAFSCVVTSIN